MPWLPIAENVLQGTRSKSIAAVTVALTALVYATFKELPGSWLPASDREAFLLRLAVTEAVALVGLIATLISVISDFVSKPQHGSVAVPGRQAAIDELAEDLSWAIHHLLNRSVSNDPEVSQWASDFKAWCDRVSLKLANRTFFSRAQQLHFDRLGFVPPANFAGSFNARHEHLISQLKIKFDRLRDIITK